MEVKLRATFLVPGAQQYSESEAKVDNLYDSSTFRVFDDKKKKWYTYEIKTRKAIPAKQVINMSEEAYLHMINPIECPSFCKPRDWRFFGKKAKLTAHLNNIAESLNGILYEYDVFEDQLLIKFGFRVRGFMSPNPFFILFAKLWEQTFI